MAAVILASAFASGCGYHPVYDESWAEQVKVESDACPVIDGDYQNAGETFLKPPIGRIEREDVSLAHLLNGWGDAGGHQADNRLGKTFYNPAEDAYQTVSLRLVEGKLHIEAALRWQQQGFRSANTPAMPRLNLAAGSILGFLFP